MNHVDFLPETIRIKRQRHGRIVRQAYLTAGLLLAMAALGAVRQGLISSAKAELTVLETRWANVQVQLDYRRELENDEARLMIRRRIKDDLGSRANALDVMSALQDILPKTIVLREMSLETIPVKIPISSTNQGASAKIANNTVKKFTIEKRLRLRITGLSPTDVDVAQFIGLMSASEFFEDVNMGYARNVEYHDRRAREFQASCYLAR